MHDGSRFRIDLAIFNHLTFQQGQTTEIKQCTVGDSDIDNCVLPDCGLVRVYHGADLLRLGDMLECVCVYTADPLLLDSVLTEEDELATGCRRYPPPSVAPRLHCVTYRKLCSSFPLLMPVTVANGTVGKISEACQAVLGDLGVGCISSFSRWSLVPVLNDKFVACTALTEANLDQVKALRQLQATEWQRVRSCVVNMLTAALGGDELAAAYVLLASLSRVCGRPNEADAALLGSLPVQLSGLAAEDPVCASLSHILALIVPRCRLVS